MRSLLGRPPPRPGVVARNLISTTSLSSMVVTNASSSVKPLVSHISSLPLVDRKTRSKYGLRGKDRAPVHFCFWSMLVSALSCTGSFHVTHTVFISLCIFSHNLTDRDRLEVSIFENIGTPTINNTLFFVWKYINRY